MRVWVFALLSLVLFVPLAFLIHENTEDPFAEINAVLSEIINYDDYEPSGIIEQLIPFSYFDVPEQEYTSVDQYFNNMSDSGAEPDNYVNVDELFNETGDTGNQTNTSEFIDVDDYLNLAYMDEVLFKIINYDDDQYDLGIEFEYMEVEEPAQFLVVLDRPPDNYYNDTCAPCSIEFVCSAISDVGLESISLYIINDSEQFFVINKTTVSGKNASASWNVEMPAGNYSWNCLAVDVNGNSTWGEKRGIIINSSFQNLTQNITANYTANETIIVLENVQPVSVLASTEPENEKINDKEHEKITFFDSFPLAVEVGSVLARDEEAKKEFDEAKNWKIEKTKVKKAEKIKEKIKIKLEDEHVEGIITDGEIRFRKIENGFAVNPITAKETLVFAKAHGTRLFKCKDWDFENEVCNGEWEFVQFLTLGKEYVVRIDENDPAFVERGPDIAYDSNGYDVTSNVSSSDDQYAQSSTSTYWVNATFSTGLSQSDAIDYAQVDCEIKRTGAGLTFDLYFDYFNYTDSTWYTVCQGLGLTPPATDSIYTCNVSDVARINKTNQTYRCRMATFLLGTWYVDMLTLSINAVPMRECGTISNSNAVYYLARNITNDSTCLTITGSNVTVDCQGNWIHGDGGAGDFGILINNGQNVTIRNCNISGFQVGIYPFFSTYSTANSPKIYNNILWNNSFGIYSVDGLGGIFENNTIYNNTYGMWGHEIDYASFIGNTFHSNQILCLALNYTWYTNLTNNVFMNSTNGSYYEFQLLNDCRYLRIENTTILNTSAYFYQAASGGANDFLNLTFGYNRTVGLVNFLKISSANEIRADSLRSILLYPDFVAVNGSVPEFNTTSRLILSSPSCPPLILTKPGFPVTKEDVLANGTSYLGAVISCDAKSSEVEVYGFSGYTLSSTPPELDGIIAYRSNTGVYGVYSPKIRFWNSTGNGNWSNEIELQAVGSPIRYAIIKWSPISSKKVLITQSDDGYLDAFVCMENCTNPLSWQYTPDIGRVWTTAPATSSRRFDVEFETVSGDAIVVYGIVDAATNRDLAYKVLPANTTNFTGITEQYIDDTGHATDIQYTWIRMDRNPQKDELIVVGFDSSNNHINAWVWDGNKWGNQIEISGAATATGGYEALAVRYAADGSKGMAIGGDGTVGNVNTRYWNGAAWSATITFDITSGNQDVLWANLKADPASDDLQGVFVDSGSRLGTAYWNGSVWATTIAIDTGLDTGVARCVDFEWDYKGSQGYLVWDTDGAGTTLSYRLCTPQCAGATQTVSTFAGTGAWLTLYRQPDATKTVRDLGIRLNSNFDIGSFYINSSAPTIYNYGDAAITADTTVSTYEAYSVAFKQDRVPPSIVFTPPTPANDSTITVNYTLINTSITDNIGVAQALLEWNGTNESMNYTNSTNWYKNKTDLAVGTYTYKVWAADYSGNWNVSETRTLSYGSPPIVIVIAPLGEEYDQHSLVSISINATDPEGINSSIAEVTLPNGTMENITLGAGLESDNFNVNTMDTNWFIENVSIGPGQTCNADIDATIPDKLFISLSGDGSPQTDTLCSVISKKAIDGDFDINISFEILGSLEPDTAFNFQITEMPGSANATKMIFIAVSNWTGFGHLYEIYASDGTFSDYI
ncbi:MAG: right-handed parallel beta-helix repeat-containing protein, partial [Candidatus Anstonellales archaeon]